MTMSHHVVHPRRPLAVLALAVLLLPLGAAGVGGEALQLLQRHAVKVVEQDRDVDKNTEDAIARALAGPQFLWGTATAAYQVEGAWNRDGRQKSIWDVFSQVPGNTYRNQTGNVADNFYELYGQDIQLLSKLGFNAFRYSIAWPRIYPKKRNGQHHPNPKGVEFYKNLTSSLLSKSITPCVTMFHWDLPEDLDWLNSSIVDAFVEYADFLFATFPEVKTWVTFNEPWTFCFLGYGAGVHAPGMQSDSKQYVCGHNVLRAHARTVALWRKKYQKPGDQIGITLNADFPFPWNASDPADVEAAQRALDFNLGWFADPVYLGDYPASMKNRLGTDLPRFTEEEKDLLNGSYHGFYGLNTYAGKYIRANESVRVTGFEETFKGVDGKLIGEKADSPWLAVVPREIKAHLEYVNDRYKPTSIVITENGCDVPDEDTLPLAEALNDTFRVHYYKAYLGQVAEAVQLSGVPVKGYFAWSLFDNFEWADGYSKRFGITYVNFTTQERHPKASAKWFKSLIARARATQN